MALDGVVWQAGDVDAGLAAQWDRMAAGRGRQADIFCSHAWLRAVLDGHPDLARTLVVPGVVGDGRAVALMPLRRQGSVWVAAHADHALRFRPTYDAALPDEETVATLVDQVGRAGVRELVLQGLPSRDPATATLLDALRRAGYQTTVSEQRTDNVVAVADHRDAHEQRLRKLATSCRARERRITPFWEQVVTTYGTGEADPADGMAQFEALSAMSWKGARRAAPARTRRSWMARADDLGWLRLKILTLDGRPAASNTYFRLGEVVFGWNTVYDQRLAVLSPGLILHHHVQQEVHAEPPEVFDLLPGSNPFKDTMAVEQPPLLTVEAVWPGALRSSSRPVRRWVRTRLPATVHRTRMELAHTRNRLRTRRAATTATEQRTRVAPDARSAAVVECEATPALQRFLAVVHGLPSASAVAARWPGARWVHVATEPGSALVRITVGPDPEISVTPLEVGTSTTRVAGAVAAHLDTTVVLVGAPGVADVASEDDLPALPWSSALLTAGS